MYQCTNNFWIVSRHLSIVVDVLIVVILCALLPAFYDSCNYFTEDNRVQALDPLHQVFPY